MTDNRGAGGQDDHYQPWLRNNGTAAAPGAGPDVARPAPLPTTRGQTGPAQSGGGPTGAGADHADRNRPPIRSGPISADELLARPIAMPPASPAAPPGIGQRLSAAMAAFADWTIRLGERADIPAKVERLELGRRARGAATAIGAGVRTGAEKSGEAARTAAAIAARAGTSAAAAAAPRVRAAADAARDGLSKGTQSARAGLGSGAAMVGAKVGETARALANAAPIPGRADDPPVIESQLDRLLADEAGGAGAGRSPRPSPSPASAAGLPLFADGANQPPPTATAAAAVAVQPAPLAAGAAAPSGSASVDDGPLPTGPAGSGHTGGGPAGGGTGGGSDRPWHRHPGTLALGAALLVSTGFAAGLYWTGPGVDRVTTERVIHDYLLNNPQILPQAMQRLQDNRAAVAVNRLRSRIERPFSGAWAGAADGDVTLTVFTDYACTFCRASLPDLERLLREDPKLKLVFRELPILSPDSDAAARLALAAAKRGRYMAMHTALFATGNPDADARRDAAVALDVPNDTAVTADPAIAREIDGNLALARELGFDGTPSWVVGDRLLTGAVGYDQLRAAVAQARAS